MILCPATFTKDGRTIKCGTFMAVEFKSVNEGHEMVGRAKCSCCGAIYEIEVKCLKESERGFDDVEFTRGEKGAGVTVT